MKGTWKLAAFISAAILSVGISSCITDNSDDAFRLAARTVEWLARQIDAQLGEVVVDDATPLCDPGGVNAGANLGDHCKNQLKGSLGPGTVTDYVRVVNEEVLFGNTPFFEKGFVPQGNPCTIDENGNDLLDYAEFSANCGAGSLSCQTLDDNKWRLTYNNCEWDDGGETWELDGGVDITVYLTNEDEQVVSMDYNDFSGVIVSSNDEYFVVNGAMSSYLVLNPFTGEGAEGTTGCGLDGMMVGDISVQVDSDGLGATVGEVSYDLFIAKDNEDGFVFLSGSSNATWVSQIMGDDNPVFFYKGKPYNNLIASGCDVTLNVDMANRLYDMTVNTPGNCPSNIVDGVNLSW